RPGDFTDTAERPDPLGRRQPPRPCVAGGRREVVVLDEPPPSVCRLVGLDRLAGEVEIESARDVDSTSAGEETKRAADARVHVEHLVLAVTRVESHACINDPAIADS